MEGMNEAYDYSKTYNYEELEHLRTKIEGMDVNSHMYILKLIRENKVDYSENKNGCFINMMNLSPSVLIKLEKYIEFIEEKEENLNELYERQEQIKKSMG